MTSESEVAELVAQLVELRDQHRVIADRIMALEDILTEAMADISLWYVEVPGLGVVRRHTGKRHTAWQHDDLFARIRLLARDPSHRHVVDLEAGEIEGEGEAVARHLRECLQPAYWRLSSLRSRGIDPDEYSSTTHGRQTIEIVR